MFITRECDYAFRIIRALNQGGRLSIGDICAQECIPTPYGYKIIKKLSHANLVEIYRGAKGGYELTCDLDEVSFYDIYRAIEGRLLLNECQRPQSYCPHRKTAKPCTIHRALNNLQQNMVQLMQNTTLRSMLSSDCEP